MKQPITFLILIVILSGCTSEEDTTTTVTTTTTMITTIPATISTIKTTSTGFPRLKPLLNETTMSADRTLNGTFINTAGYPIRLLEVTGPCKFQYPKSKIASTDGFEITGRNCKIPGGAGERYATSVDIKYLVLTPGPVNEYTDHGTLRGSIVQNG